MRLDWEADLNLLWSVGHAKFSGVPTVEIKQYWDTDFYFTE